MFPIYIALIFHWSFFVYIGFRISSYCFIYTNGLPFKVPVPSNLDNRTCKKSNLNKFEQHEQLKQAHCTVEYSGMLSESSPVYLFFIF